MLSNRTIEDGEELPNGGSVTLLNDGVTDCTGGLTSGGCHWSIWDAAPSGQLNPQTTDSQGKYGWNVPMGWYRVSFQKPGAYGLSYTRDVYVPPAETGLNVDIGPSDLAAPSVVSANPANAAVDVARSVAPTVLFSESMLASTVNATNIQLLNGGSAVTATVDYSAAAKTATITPGASLAALTAYTIRVTTGVKDSASNALSSAYESTFTTAGVADGVAPHSASNLLSGVFTSAQSVSLSATDDPGTGVVAACPGCPIYYTLDGSTPTPASAAFYAGSSSPIAISTTTTLKFRAYDASGNAEADPNVRTYTIHIVVPPTAPTGLVAGALSGAISLNWDEMAYATGYKVYRSTVSGSGYALVASPAQSLYADYGVAYGTHYYYKVAATNAAGDSVLSAEVSATPLVASSGGGGGGAISPYANLIAPNGGQSLSPGSVYSITWSAGGSGVAGVKISLSIDGGSTYPSVVSAQATGLTFNWTVPNVAATRARIKVETVNSSGTVLGASDVSNGDFAITGTAATLPTMPTNGGTVGESVSALVAAGLTDAEKAAPMSDPNLHGAYSAASASASTPSIDLNMNLLIALPNAVCNAGDLIKTAGSSTVYYCGRDAKRHAFPNERIFYSWFDNFVGVKTVTAGQLASLPLGQNVTYKPGERMIKIQTDPKVYAVSRGGVLRWVQTEAVAVKLYGTNWNRMIDDVSDAFFFNYVIGDPITPADAGL